MAHLIVAAEVEADLLVLSEGLSFWGGVDPATSTIIDAHHDQQGQSLAGRIVLMPTSRGSCSGSGILLALALNGCAPAALVFREDEGILTLGALIASSMFDHSVAVLRLSDSEYDALSKTSSARITAGTIKADGLNIEVKPLPSDHLDLSASDQAMLEGREGPAVQLAMKTICSMATLQGASGLIDVSRVHIDACIYHSLANLRFAQRMKDMGAKVRIPTTTNAISVDHENWREQLVPSDFGEPASELVDLYLQMGAQPTFTCAPYHLEDTPDAGEDIGWSESNAVIYANSILGARTAKHPDYLDLFIALTGRAPKCGVYLDANRAARRRIEVELPEAYDDALWPLLGWLAGQKAPDRIPLLTGLEASAPSQDDLRALCAAFGTTSAAPLLHIAGITPESALPAAPNADSVRITRTDFLRAWQEFNAGGEKVDLISLGSPHFSLAETRSFAALMANRRRRDDVAVIITLGRGILEKARDEGLIAQLEQAGVQVVPDVCWCSITEPIFPPTARVLMTNSGKYAHYAPGLCGREVRFGSLADCAQAAETGLAPSHPPEWLV